MLPPLLAYAVGADLEDMANDSGVGYDIFAGGLCVLGFSLRTDLRLHLESIEKLARTYIITSLPSILATIRGQRSCSKARSQHCAESDYCDITIMAVDIFVGHDVI
jgi:hypothetical protein